MKLKSYILLASALSMVSGFGAQRLQGQPDGVSIVLERNGAYTISAIGTGTYDFDDQDDIMDARQNAEMSAKAAIVKFMKEEVSSEEKLDEITRRVKVSVSDGSDSATLATRESVKLMTKSIRVNSAALLKGVRVVQEEKEKIGSGGRYRVKVEVSSKTMKVAEAVANGEQVVPQPPPQAVARRDGGTAAPAVQTTSVQATVAVSAGLPPPPEGWLACVGVGINRRAAVLAALIEGIGQVYGEKVSHVARFENRIKRFKARFTVGDETATGSASLVRRESESATLSVTEGFVKAYRIIQVLEKGGQQEATVYIHVYDPSAGGAPSVLVRPATVSLSEGVERYQLGPKRRLSGVEVTEEVFKALPCALSTANKFIVIPGSSADEGGAFDYDLSTEVSDIRYSKKLGWSDTRKRACEVYSFSLRVRVGLQDARSGRLVRSEDLTLKLDSDEIAALLEEDTGADLLLAALRKLAKPVRDWLNECAAQV